MVLTYPITCTTLYAIKYTAATADELLSGLDLPLGSIIIGQVIGAKKYQKL